MRLLFFIIAASIAIHGGTSWPVIAGPPSFAEKFDEERHFVAGVAQRVDTPPLYEPTQVMGQRLPYPPYVVPGPPMEIPYLSTSRNTIVPLPRGFKMLFVDNYFIDLNDTVGVRFVHHQFKFHRQLFPGARLGFGGRPGGIVYDPARKRHALYTSCVRKTSDGNYPFYPYSTAICVSFSQDNGATWGILARISVPFFDNADPIKEVLREKFSVRFRSDPGYGTSRYILGAVSSRIVFRAGIDRMSWGPFRIFTSSDGVHFQEGPVLGTTLDATSFTWDPWARRWVFYLKDNFNHWVRVVRFHSTRGLTAEGWPDFVDRCSKSEYNNSTKSGATTTEAVFGRCDSPESTLGALFLAAHNRDPPYTPDSSETTPRMTDLYEFDSEVYENSVRIGVRHIHTGGRLWPKILHPYFAYSRDGFHYSTAQAVAIPSRSFAEEYCCVATFLVRNDNMSFFCTATDPRDAEYFLAEPKLSKTNGALEVENTSIPITSFFEYRMRRDGFVGIKFSGPIEGRAASLSTRWVKLHGPPHVVSINAECTRTGYLRVAIQQYGDQGHREIGTVQRLTSGVAIQMRVNPNDFTTSIIRLGIEGKECELFSVVID
eukprot:TRINITY_DN1225_c0_g1_i2.p1 TRINITY_DN1225_c0_g1~~TRINITY_DN1225_c0_g1_i2.p1  ORF type:complete len:600 (+),score=-166.44 TRINITY_DN1225_c0_g1_i2:112-1911(+)